MVMWGNNWKKYWNILREKNQQTGTIRSRGFNRLSKLRIISINTIRYSTRDIVKKVYICVQASWKLCSRGDVSCFKCSIFTDRIFITSSLFVW